jgi:hypothetical protein
MFNMSKLLILLETNSLKARLYESALLISIALDTLIGTKFVIMGGNHEFFEQ